MKYVKMSLQIFCLYIIYRIGVIIQSLADLPIPGSIIGMILLFGALYFKVVKREWFSLGSTLLLKQLPLFFIPATVGVIEYLDLFKGSGLITIGIALISTLVVMIVSSFMSDSLLAKDTEVSKDKGLQL
ncbi:CidA/LrgA family protein [Metabacillus sediminilitoris]|uniref:CidA/LrgA family holin-like protein n=1 Tax=Metabacillus sediminilitoris TaxID=2567941 RepID=A0A4S4C4E5_9BACI|nr:CidA/LrgA family holin-like protein [Metabacillus sediminilitoris]QGQ47569.1 CidA/LrgA family holin-like protein [Metabacillus sediminilitoris]THF82002.1 CidA/LrgA family holin-like protein [Metabacillus sediminilitoris]